MFGWEEGIAVRVLWTNTVRQKKRLREQIQKQKQQWGAVLPPRVTDCPVILFPCWFKTPAFRPVTSLLGCLNLPSEILINRFPIARLTPPRKTVTAQRQS